MSDKRQGHRISSRVVGPRQSNDAEAQRTPLLILTGFLGSGKTTLLNRLLRDPAMRQTAVLVNELGEVAVDHLLVDTVDDDIVLLESGCVCCTVRDDLCASLLALEERRASGRIPPFQQVVLETTGVANPAPVVQFLMEDRRICELFTFGAVVTVVDACFGTDTLQTAPEALEQLVFANAVALSKTDLAEPATVQALRESITDANPDALRFDSRRMSPADLEHVAHGANAGRGLHRASAGHAGAYSTFVIRSTEPVAWRHFEVWLEGLLSARGNDILRMKGLLHVAGEPTPLLVQSVQSSLYQPLRLESWWDDVPATELVFITRHFSRKAVLNSLRPYLPSAA